MKRFILLLALALPLGACAMLPQYNNPLKPNTFAAVQNSYGAALAVFVNYREACAQRLIPQTCRTAVQTLQPYIRKAEGARQAALNFIARYPKLDATKVIFAMQDAVNDFKVVQMEAGIR